jgi:hypothetical protein
MILVGFTAWVDVATEVEDFVFALVGAAGLVGIAATIVNLLKEKFGIAVIGLLLPPVGIVAAFRLGRPHSPWGRLFYGDDKRARAEARFSDRRPPWRPRKHEAASGQSAAGSG